MNHKFPLSYCATAVYGIVVATLGLGVPSAYAGQALSGQALRALVLPAKPPVPADNPMTPAKVALGKELFFDPRLSSTGTISCDSCHNVMGDGTDNRKFSQGVNGTLDTDRNTPTVFNAAFLSVQFWDGRAASLEAQAKGPLLNPKEMGMTNGKEVAARIDAIPGYRAQFKKVFKGAQPVTFNNITKAIATYERTLITPNSPFDRYARGNKNAISPAARKGFMLVQQVGCTACHSGPMFNGPQLPMGQGFFMRFPTYTNNKYVAEFHLMAHLGRYQVTHNPADKHMWIVQSWRNVALTAPYFNNGSVNTLPQAVRVMAKVQLNKTLTAVQVRDIVAFLDSLTGQFPRQTMPRLPMTENTALPVSNE
ncbi:MAG: cytochrome-c peroxidase [Acidiferrobacter sp.]